LRETYKNPSPGRDPTREDASLSLGNVQNMTRAHRNVNIGAVILPFVAFVAALPLLWNELVGWTDLAILAGVYFVTAVSITVGFHRMLTHRAFETYRPVKYALAVLGSMAVQGDVIAWVSDHRKHHAFTDEEGDPHSPHVGHGEGWRAALRGLFHAHVGWLFVHHSGAEAKRFAPDLLEDPGMRLISRAFIPLVGVSLAIPFGLGYLATGELAGALTALLWGGLVRVFLVHHVTWSINSICHFFGRRRFETDDESTNVFWLALPSLGESWHHNHHAFPRSAVHGLRWWEIDVSGWVIRAMQRLGLAWNVVRITPERQRAKLAT
jgi:stearoyl-CoA desaturase (Delta-9 desaturase)